MVREAADPRHVSRPEAASTEPSYAERARALVSLALSGTLSTHSSHVPGFPFGSSTPYGLDELGQPTFLFSGLAMHTHNLRADPRASLFIPQADWTGDLLAGGRVSLLGRVLPVPSGDIDSVRAGYLTRHRQAEQWADFRDFGFYRMEITAIYYVAGFGAMGWVARAEYRAAAPGFTAAAI